MTYRLTSTCDDAGNLLAARLDNPDYTRTIGTYESKQDAETARQEWIRWYAANRIAIGAGCLAIESDMPTIVRHVTNLGRFGSTLAVDSGGYVVCHDSPRYAAADADQLEEWAYGAEPRGVRNAAAIALLQRGIAEWQNR